MFLLISVPVIVVGILSICGLIIAVLISQSVKMEEEECRAEGIACPVLEFADNSQVMELLQQKPAGVLSLTNEEVVVPNSSDANLLQKIGQKHRGHPAFKPMPRAHGEGFIVTHFAGPVDYHIDGFVDKNRDTLPGELSLLFGASGLPLLAALFRDKTDAAEWTMQGYRSRASSRVAIHTCAAETSAALDIGGMVLFVRTVLASILGDIAAPDLLEAGEKNMRTTSITDCKGIDDPLKNEEKVA